VNTYSVRVATAVVIANMIGTGVFTSLGFQLLDIQSTTGILWLWAIGGVCALSGALCYAELGARNVGSGGEYHFLTELVHPYAGFVSGCVSATVGFAAPIALASLTFGVYLATALPAVPAKLSATLLILVMVALHTRTRRDSAQGQFALTLLKIVLIVVFIATALVVGADYDHQLSGPVFSGADDMLSGGGAVALIYVMYAYSGWNAATYILGELENPQRDLPRALIVGCIIVTCIYVALNAVFLISAPIDELRGEVEVAYIVADYVVGEQGAFAVSLLLSGILISTVSAMIMAGPRALQRLGEAYSGFSLLGRPNKAGIPANAIFFMGFMALIFLWTSTFEKILLFSGFVMAANTFITVLAVFVSRRRHPKSNAFGMPWYPLPAIVFLLITGWTLVYTGMQFPLQVMLATAIIALGYPLFVFSHRRGAR